MANVTYVGPHDEVEFFVGEIIRTAKQGETVEVPDHVAGRPPKGDPDSEKFDPGEGLLAQAENWQAVKEQAPARATSLKERDDR